MSTERPQRGLRLPATTRPRPARWPLAVGMLVPVVMPLSARAAEEIPTSLRIPAHVIRSLTCPADAPMRMPTDVAVDRAGRAFVADGVNDRVVRFDTDGRFAGAITEIGGAKLARPVGVSVDSADRLWIADSDHHRVIVMAADGAVVEIIALPTPDGGRPATPAGIAITADRRRAYIVDNANHRVLVRDNTTGRLTSMGRMGRAVGQFEWPFMVSISPRGYVYISEVIGACVERISPEGRWAGQVPPGPGWGVALGQLYRPKGVEIDARGQLYVSDSTLGVVQVYGLRGETLGVLTDQNGQPMRFRHPMGMAFDAAELLYVVELRADCVAVVSLPTAWTRPPATSSAPSTTTKEADR